MENPSRPHALISQLLLVFVFIYIGLRAFFIPIFHDEALTFLLHFNLPVADIIAFRGPIPENNHLINTLLVRIFTGIYGLHEFTMRLPALIGAAVFLIFAYKALALYLRRWQLVPGVLITAGNPFLIEILSSGRGYALGLGFFVVSLYIFLRQMKSGEATGALPDIVFISALTLAVLSHLTFLNVYLTMLVLFAASRILMRRNGAADIIVQAISGLISAAVLFFVYYKPLKRMMSRTTGPFDIYAGKIGLWHDTVQSLIESSMYGQGYWVDMALTLKIAVIAVLLSALALVLMDILLKRGAASSPVFWLLAAIIVCTAGVVFQHRIFGVPYVHERYAIFYVPLFTFLLVFTLSGLAETAFKPFMAVSWLIAALLSINLLMTVNLSYSYIYKMDTFTREVVGRIAGETRQLKDRRGAVRVGISWTFEPGVNFYIIKNNYSWLRFVDRSGPGGDYDYYYFIEQDRKSIPQGTRVLDRFDVSKSAAEPNYAYLAARSLR